MEKDLTGTVFGSLTVLKRAQKSGTRRRYWVCRCRCGRETVVEESHLKDGHTKSCGCLRSSAPRRRTTDLTGKRFGRLTAVSPAEGGWLCRCDCGREIVCTKENLTSGNTRSCGCLREETRRENMRKAIHFVGGTCVERIASRGTAANNTSGHRGVYRRENGRWRASIGFRGKVYNLGSFESYEAAVEARLAAEKEFYDRFLRDLKAGDTRSEIRS